MEQVPNWLAAAVLAAGMTTVYNADDWTRAPLATTPAAEPSHDALPGSPAA